jgi:crossover junction endodeoxyribonuclease RuvC
LDYVIGLDPGFTGAIASLELSTGLLNVEDMPVYPNKKGRTELNYGLLFQFLTPPPGSQVMAILEQVAARPGQGAPATFRFGQGYGAIEMALAAHQIPTHYVTPAVWKKYFGLSKDKGVSRGLATQRFPANSSSFIRVKDDGRAEATLIAQYGVEKILVEGILRDKP